MLVDWAYHACRVSCRVSACRCLHTEALALRRPLPCLVVHSVSANIIESVFLPIKAAICDLDRHECLLDSQLIWCLLLAANTTGLVGYDFGAQSAFASVGAETDVAGKDVQAR